MSPTTRTVIAVILSIIIPGVGHMFVGRVKRGVVVLLLGVGGLVAISFIIPFPYSLPFTIIIYIVVIWDLFHLAIWTATGWDANRVMTVVQEANKRLSELGYDVQNCLVDLGETAESIVLDSLSRENFDCIMIGAGVRLMPQHTVLFEKIINAVHQNAPPSSKICFNTNPGDTAEAVLRWG
jgi:hypothetical protein